MNLSKHAVRDAVLPSITADWLTAVRGYQRALQDLDVAAK